MIVVTLKRLFAPLILAFESRSAAMVLLEDLGWTLDESFDLDALETLDPVKTRLLELVAVAGAYDPEDPDVGSIVEQAVLLGQDIYTAIEQLQDLADGDVANLAAPLNSAEFWTEFALDLPEYLLLTYLRVYLPPLYALVMFGGAVVPEDRPGGRPARDTLDWEALGRLLTDPAGQIRDTYAWGGQLRHVLMIERLEAVFGALGLPVYRFILPEAIAADRYPDGGAADVSTLDLPLFAALKQKAFLASDTLAASASAEVDLSIVPVPGTPTGNRPDGLLLTLRALGGGDLSFDMGGGWSAGGAVNLDASGLVGLELQPTGLSVATGMPSGDMSVSLSAVPPTPFILFGKENGSRLELASFTAQAGIALSAQAPDINAGMDLSGLKLVVAAGDGDGFIAETLEGIELAIPITLGIDWSTREGLRLNAGAGFEIEFVIDRDFGPIHIDTVAIGGEVSGAGGSVWGATTGSAKIGPFVGVVSNIGLKVAFVPQPRGSGGGNGAVRTTIGFKPPDGLGLAVLAPGVKGGGYLELNHEEGRYAGVLEVQLFGFSVTAIGIVATKLPGGEDGWSMFLSISVIFPTPIVLVFGFTLTGVGGLVGVNRSIDIEALGEGVRSGSLNAVLFPQDAIANAPAILSALESIFPAQKGQFVFGPIFQLGWGPKGLLTIELGLAIQLPSPLTISLLGSLQIKVGVEDENLVFVRVDVAGTLWPTEGRLWIDAGITQGNIAGLTLAGDMAVRLETSPRPNMIASMGGFHPQFTPPEGFPNLARLSLTIINTETVRIGVESYIALSSNAFHFGVAAFFSAEAIGFVADGRFEFDTLIIFRPFGLTAALNFQVAISAGSVEILQVRLSGTLTGPKPWFVTGYAEFKVLGLKKKFCVEAQIGRALSQGPRETVALFDEVLAALGEDDAWTSAAPDMALLEAVTFVAADGARLLHPAGRVSVGQGVAPLGIRLERFGDARIADGEDLLEIAAVMFGNDLAEFDEATEWFAPANFFDMSYEEKITAPSFEELACGAVCGPTAVGFAGADPFELGYNSIVVDPDVETKWPQDQDAPRGAKDSSFTFPNGEPGIAGGLELDLVKSVTGSAAFSVTDPALVVTEGAGLAERPARSFTAALARTRELAAKGRAGTIQPAYERNLEVA